MLFHIIRKGVAGVSTPAFVERINQGLVGVVRRYVLPGFRLRPSLSDDQQVLGEPECGSVAGVSTPAFVERYWQETVQF